MESLSQTEIKLACKKVLANEVALYWKSSTYHWNTTGPKFLYLHDFFQKVYENMEDSLDDLAEHIRAMGYFIPNNLPNLLQTSSISFKEGKLNDREMLEDLRDSLSKAYKDYYELFSILEIINNQEFMDFLAERMSSAKKFIWMIDSTLEDFN